MGAQEHLADVCGLCSHLTLNEMLALFHGEIGETGKALDQGLLIRGFRELLHREFREQITGLVRQRRGCVGPGPGEGEQLALGAEGGHGVLGNLLGVPGIKMVESVFTIESVPADADHAAALSGHGAVGDGFTALADGNAPADRVCGKNTDIVKGGPQKRDDLLHTRSNGLQIR